MLPRRGVAIHINAFNFPSWGLWEKAAVSLVAGVPVVAKPASATALLAHAMVKDVIAAKVLPRGCAEPRLRQRRWPACRPHSGRCHRLYRLGRHGRARARSCQRGGQKRAGQYRGRQHQCRRCLRRAPRPGARRIDAFLREVVREMTVKAGQKCTAIRRIFVPAGQIDAIADTLAEKLKGMKVGDPREADTRMGPLVTRAQQAAAFDGIRRLGVGGVDRVRRRRCASSSTASMQRNRRSSRRPCCKLDDAGSARAVHEVEVFGPAATVVPYRDEAQACALIARGGGSLVASVYADDQEFLAAHGERDRSRPWTHPGGRSGDCERAYRPRHRHAAMQSRRSGPCRGGRGARRRLRASLLSPAPGGAGLERSFRGPAGEGGEPALEHVPQKWGPVLRKRTCSNKRIERDDDKKSHPALAR